MEDALISPASFAVLSGAGLLEGMEKTTPVHVTEDCDAYTSGENGLVVGVEYKPHVDKNNMFYIYAVPLDDNGDMNGLPVRLDYTEYTQKEDTRDGKFEIKLPKDKYPEVFKEGKIFKIDYYYMTTKSLTEIDITPDKFAGNYYLEASTLFRTKQGVDLPAEFTIPNCKIQSNFTFTMASTGDPSTFNFTMDAFPDYPKFARTKKVLAALQVIEDVEVSAEDIESETVTVTGPDAAPAAAAAYPYRRNSMKSTIEE